MNVPNLLSLSRLILSPLILYFVLEENYLSSLVLVLFLALMDFLDGFFARKLNQSTRMGKILDPLADKVFTFFSLLSYTFFSKERLNPLIFFLLLGRDITLIIGGIFLIKRKFTPEPSIYGKFTTLFVSLSLLSVGILNVYDVNFLRILTNVLEIVSLILILVSWVDYTLKGFKMIFKE
ncbi:CDP-alcohol phosphatidyltransferase family protein [Aquifex aeolicus]|uniref:CDP-diacylglycerol--glycerol-3-phosphate 3-phosphatidyltransferase n=1 Tax=Aquifex aeolicus (strain VF5) TaxID=224324 RepID=PGSA_AQUAE|nr:CDP-alcohol phosphatidyltransferase family protein [Aquifex aeolicus]O67908.1 RecName: Full=CDP-diacylglycerol--glycerol-3-phosphate 3-phosphatidyltransferase; AltName: Full=Phosphatidylglycerophosphate synthase; Short=PGP synthase [Aquifex aeolicus VF5]AAC07866.1 phosphotidylglycerophosphate synthase [Aquifex aeolicus VF5]